MTDIYNGENIQDLKDDLEFSKIKDESYQIIWDMGGNGPDYFEKRDEKLKQILNENNLNEDFMDTFYEIYLSKYYKKLLEIVEKNEL